MTTTELDAMLRTVCPDTYELAAPPDKQRAVVWHTYGFETVSGSDTIQYAIPRVQLDVLWQRADDSLYDEVTALLEVLCLPYDILDYGYDDEYALMRAILQIEVV